MICKCGYQNEPDDFYCAQCGRKLGKKKGGKGWIIAIVAVLLAAALGVGAWFLLRGEEPDPEPTEPSEEINDGVPEDDEGARPSEGEDDAEEAHPDGWDGLLYYLDGEPLKGQQQVEGEYYYFSEETGEKQTGWHEIGGSWYYYTDEGPAPGEGWYEDDTGWFYLEESGRHHTETPMKLGNATFTLDDEGYLLSTVYDSITCSSEKALVNGQERDVLMFPGTLTGCQRFDFTVQRATGVETQTESFDASVWVCRNGSWDRAEDAEVRRNEAGNGFTLTFTKPLDISGVYVALKTEAPMNVLITNLMAVR